MRCPYCGYGDSKVVDSRPTEEGTSIRRRRECLNHGCEKRFTTYETIESVPLMVIKKDGSRRQFNRENVLKGIIRSCEKRGVDLKTMEKAALEIEQTLFNRLEREVKSEVIGELVMEKLINIDRVAYVRFASVYREFKDVSHFKEEIEKLLAGK